MYYQQWSVILLVKLKLLYDSVTTCDVVWSDLPLSTTWGYFMRRDVHVVLSYVLDLVNLLHVPGVRGSALGWGTALQAGRSRIRIRLGLRDFSLTQSFWPHFVPGVDSYSNRNKHQGSSLEVNAAGALRCQPCRLHVPMVWESWEPQPPGVLGAYLDLCRDVCTYCCLSCTALYLQAP
jgi:hypothetical protein